MISTESIRQLESMWVSASEHSATWRRSLRDGMYSVVAVSALLRTTGKVAEFYSRRECAIFTVTALIQHESRVDETAVIEHVFAIPLEHDEREFVPEDECVRLLERKFGGSWRVVAGVRPFVFRRVPDATETLGAE